MIGPDGRHEATAALEMSLTVKYALERAGWDARLTRDGTKGAKPDLATRVRHAAGIGSAALVSIHYNSSHTYPLVYFAPGMASLSLARRLAHHAGIPDDKIWETEHSRFRGLYIDAFPDERPAILWEVAAIDAAPPVGTLGRTDRLALAAHLVAALEPLRRG